jgi:hypothetical protein
MDRSLFLLPSDKINWNDIQAFLDQYLEESSVLDYTELRTEKDFEGILKIIVAMANTDGGIILVGVSKDSKETNRPGSSVGIEPKYLDPLKNKCRSLLQPAFVPEMVQIAIPNDEKIILLIRINPERHPRPVILKDIGILVRVSDSNQHADLYRLQQLFGESKNNTNIPISRGSFSPSSILPLENEHDLLIRFVLSGKGSISQGFNSTIKRQIIDSLQNCPIEKWFRECSQPFSLNIVKPTTSTYLTISSSLSANSKEQTQQILSEQVIGVRFHIALPGLHQSSELILDVWFKGSPKSEDVSSFYPLKLDDFYKLLLAGLSTVTNPSILQQLPEGFMLWSDQIFVHVDAKKTPWLDVSDIPCVETIRSSDFFQDQVTFSDSQRLAELDTKIKGWLKSLLSDAGCMDHESKIETMNPPDFLYE